jgi:hypothetical protein
MMTDDLTQRLEQGVADTGTAINAPASINATMAEAKHRIERLTEELAAIKAQEPYVIIYEYDHGLFGRHQSFSAGEWNGMKPTRAVALYTASQPSQKPVDVEVICEACDGSGNDRADNNYGCEVCQGSGRVTKQFYTASQPAPDVEAALKLAREAIETISALGVLGIYNGRPAWVFTPNVKDRADAALAAMKGQP